MIDYNFEAFDKSIHKKIDDWDVCVRADYNIFVFSMKFSNIILNEFGSTPYCTLFYDNLNYAIGFKFHSDYILNCMKLNFTNKYFSFTCKSFFKKYNLDKVLKNSTIKSSLKNEFINETIKDLYILQLQEKI